MRIMVINTYYYPEIVGGAEYSVKKLSEKLVQEGHTVRVLCTGKENSKEIIDGVEVVRIKDGVVAVSYTHLDVYKRQPPGWAAPAR